jgi:hypothetical protein
VPAATCPKCGFAYAWNGVTCGHCQCPQRSEPPRDRLLPDLPLRPLCLWLFGLLLAAFTGWYPANHWEAHREEVPIWHVVAGAVSALVVGFMAVSRTMIPWNRKVSRFLTTIAVYLLMACLVWFVTIMRNGFGNGG